MPVVKSPPANAEDKRRGSNPWVGKTPWRRAREPTPIFLLENPSQETVKDREARRAAGHGVSESDTT